MFAFLDLLPPKGSTLIPGMLYKADEGGAAKSLGALADGDKLATVTQGAC
jgi:hypothetical protein